MERGTRENRLPMTGTRRRKARHKSFPVPFVCAGGGVKATELHVTAGWFTLFITNRTDAPRRHGIVKKRNAPTNSLDIVGV